MNGNRRPPAHSPVTDSTHPLHLKPNSKHIARVAAMIVSFFLMVLALGGAGQFLLQILDQGIMEFGVAGIFIQLTLYGLILLLALGVSWLGTRPDVGNAMIPTAFEGYKVAVALSSMYLYYEIITRLFRQAYNLPRFGAYLLFLGGSVLLLFILNSFSQTKKLRWHGGGILAMCMAHLLVMFALYGLQQNKLLDYFFADLIILLMMVTSGVVMIIPHMFFRSGQVGKRNVWRGNPRPPGGA